MFFLSLFVISVAIAPAFKHSTHYRGEAQFSTHSHNLWKHYVEWEKNTNEQLNPDNRQVTQ